MRSQALAIGLLGLLVGAGAAALVVEHFVDAQDHPGTGVLAVDNRSQLSVCVDDTSAGPVPGMELAMVQQTLDSVRLSYPNERGFSQAQAIEGCPSAAALSGPPPADDVAQHYGLERAVELRGNAVASPHRVFIYYVPSDVYTDYLGRGPYALGAAEMLCSEDQCWEVTTSLYLPSSATGDTVQRGLLDALGLLPYEPQPTPNWSACAQGTPEPWCVRYEDQRAAQ